ncbi:hypothetical protein EYW47_31035 [Paraburkholderia silviterrae]|uniref:Uncharacterized protein n=1 Tax=Paraburkholderia silviterrae TaxID=2528715 RepID=A0A4R5M2X2_9BURK|nr:hypothetical protein EYW47_31035 [Paraburkholderia silviterrae]
MNTLAKNSVVHTTAFLILILFACATSAADSQRDPASVLTALVDRIYVLGETSGNVDDMIAAEAKAADEVRQYVASGAVVVKPLWTPTKGVFQ